MEWFKGAKVDELIVLRLDRGEDIQKSVEKLAKDEDIQSGVVVSGIGTLEKARLHMVTSTDYPVLEEFVEMECPLEVTAIDGIIADYHPHLHITIGDTKQAYAGHLELGCRVLYLAELVILKLSGLQLTRINHPETAIPQLKVKLD